MQLQPIFPDKSINQLAYLFGVVCKRIGEHTGDPPQRVYAAYKEYFKLEYSEISDGNWQLRYKGASDFDTVDLEEFALMIRADAVIEMGLNIELPNEAFISELDFEDHDRIQGIMDRSERRIIRTIPKLSYKVYNRKAQ